MMDNNVTSPTEEQIAQNPFAGRQAIFARIQQYLIDPTDRHALLFVGRKKIGKTATLWQCQHVLDEHVLGCYIPLIEVTFTNEADWLTYLVQQTNQTLEAHQLNITRLPVLPEDKSQYRDYLNQDYLPDLSKLIRPHRRLVWLFDDMDYLIEAIDSKKLPEDTFEYLFDLLQTHLQLGIVLTLSERNESKIAQLHPLVDPTQAHKLHLLSLEETSALLKLFSSHIDNGAQEKIYQLTNGHPVILQAIGRQLQTIPYTPLTETDLKTMEDIGYQKANSIYQHIWDNVLSPNERLILNTMAGLLYDDPLASITSHRIEQWLIETDYPMDLTAINASIRGLDYQDLVIGSTSEGITIRAELFKRWLLEHARIDKPSTWSQPQQDSQSDTIAINQRGLVIIAILTIVLMLIFALSQQSSSNETPPIQPTVTLETR